MPFFELVPLQEALRSAAPSKRQRMLEEYIGYIDQLKPEQAGKLVPSEGETSLTVRRRLNTAAKQAGKDLELRRVGDEVIFWLKTAPYSGKRRGRPRKLEQTSETAAAV